ncbi:hypothetical protein DYB38_006812 [Aphanomyces astaci]|uniref:MORN repeat-containing protein 5 n=3 Tax=Aphanomyces astaci TaxID=112090 RepID=A0A397D812_APHAT|nr:hypothetical protein DYB38_006812 [Aphanomyces astaci]
MIHHATNVTQGTLHYYDGDFYKGHWKDGKMDAHGVYQFHNGDRYDGEWVEDQRHGRGTIVYKGGDGHIHEKYEWCRGQMHGNGAYWYGDGSLYEGEWKSDQMHGNGTPGRYGVYKWRKGELVFKNRDVFVGEWGRDGNVACGVLTFANGDKYEGQVVGHMRHGSGTFYCKTDGKSYHGEWQHNKKHGSGSLRFPSGEVLRGEWKEGSLVPGSLVLTLAPASPWLDPLY